MSSSEPYFEGLSLARLDSRADAADDRDQIQALLRDVSQDDLRPPYEGADASGSVWVSVSDRARVENVEFSRYWSDRLAPADVARALQESYNDAARKAYTAAALLSFEREEEGGPAPSRVTEPDIMPLIDDHEAWLRTVRATQEEIEIDLRRLSRGEIERDQEDTIAGPLGCFRARVRGQAVLEITGDTWAIRESSADQLRREALGMFRRAQGSNDEVN